MAHTITVVIEKDGKTNIKVDGMKGKSCLDITKLLEDALGTVEKRTPTREMSEKPTIADKTKVGAGG
jgi:hypothetical protein